jgi:acyl-CoA reductase-like NAD-dependent aldehyde dehydrogenase
LEEGGLMADIGKLIEQNDDNLKVRENELINKVNIAYEKAIKEAFKEFKYLEKLNPNIKPSKEQVRKILKRTMAAFSEEMEKLIEPISKATQESYQEGLSETEQILKELKGE